MGWISEGEVAQSCPTLWDPVDCSLPGFSIHGIFQARVLEWVAISFSRGSSQPRDTNPGLLHCRQTLYPLSQENGLNKWTVLAILYVEIGASQVVLMVKNLLVNAGDTGDAGSNPGLERSPGIGNGNPLLYSCLENSIDREAWGAAVHGVTELDMPEHACMCTHRVKLKRSVNQN